MAEYLLYRVCKTLESNMSLTSFRSWSRPARRRSNAIWRRGAWMGNSGPLVGLSCTKPAPSQPPEDRLLFMLTYVKTYALQVVQGRLFGMVQSKANRWIHVLLPVLLAALRSLGDAPARSLTALAQRLGVAEADAATLVTPLEEEPTPVVAPDAPLLPMTGPNGALSAPKTLRNRPRVIAARKKITPSRMSC